MVAARAGRKGRSRSLSVYRFDFDTILGPDDGRPELGTDDSRLFVLLRKTLNPMPAEEA